MAWAGVWRQERVKNGFHVEFCVSGLMAIYYEFPQEESVFLWVWELRFGQGELETPSRCQVELCLYQGRSGSCRPPTGTGTGTRTGGSAGRAGSGVGDTYLTAKPGEREASVCSGDSVSSLLRVERGAEGRPQEG